MKKKVIELEHHLDISVQQLDADLQSFKDAVYLPAKNNRGFDIIVFENTDKGNIGFCIECKFSDPTSTTGLTLQEIQIKAGLMHGIFESTYEYGKNLYQRFELTEERVFLIVCAFRKVQNLDIKELPNNVIVLNKEELSILYTPTLSTRPQFICNQFTD